MISQNMPTNGGNVYRSGTQGTAVGKSAPSQTTGTSYTRATEAKWVTRKPGVTKPKSK